MRNLALKTSASLQGNALNILSPTGNQNHNSQAAWNQKSNREHMKIEEMDNNIFGETGIRTGKQFITPSRRQILDRTVDEIKLLQDAARRANTTLKDEADAEVANKAGLPSLSIDEKRKILN